MRPSTVFMPSGSVTADRAEQPENAPAETVSTPAGIVTEVRPLFAKVHTPISVRPDGRSMEVREEQPSKAPRVTSVPSTSQIPPPTPSRSAGRLTEASETHR